jgi:predicted transposase YdaD
MFTGIEGYDVQETRRVAKREGLLEGKRIGISEGISKGKSIGILEGKRQGEYASRLEIARNMQREQMDASLIAALTGLTADEINSL